MTGGPRIETINGHGYRIQRQQSRWSAHILCGCDYAGGADHWHLYADTRTLKELRAFLADGTPPRCRP